MNTLRQAAQEYLTMRRSLGYKLQEAGRRLLDFITFMEQHRAAYITQSLALAWAKQPSDVQPCEWARRLSCVRSFARHRSASDPRTQIPPAGLLPYRPKRAQPYMYSDEEIKQLLRATLKLPAKNGLRPWTYHCLFGLLSVTGLRVSEAQNLELQDVDLRAGVLTIRGTKFGSLAWFRCTLQPGECSPTTWRDASGCGRTGRSPPTYSCPTGATDWMAATFAERFTPYLVKSGCAARPIVMGRACTT
jgi:integrase